LDFFSECRQARRNRDPLRQARAAAARVATEEAGTNRLLRAAEANLLKLEAALKDMERRLAMATTPQIKERMQSAKAKALVRLGEIQTHLQATRLEAQAKRNAGEHATEEVRAEAAERDKAAEAVDEVTRETLPVSRMHQPQDTETLCAQGQLSHLRGLVSIGAAEVPIGTFVFTAIEPLGTSSDMRWNVVAMYRNPTTSSRPRRLAMLVRWTQPMLPLTGLPSRKRRSMSSQISFGRGRPSSSRTKARAGRRARTPTLWW
jgi:hypothetical protein